MISRGDANSQPCAGGHGAVVLGGVQLVSAKGTGRHRALGWAWVGLMTYVAISSFFISELRL